MQRPLTNVTGQIVVPVLVARSEGHLDEAVFNAPPQSLDEAPATPARTAEPALA